MFIQSTKQRIYTAANGGENTARARDLDHTKGGLNSKVHLVCDDAGKPVHLHISAGNQANIRITGRLKTVRWKTEDRQSKKRYITQFLKYKKRL